MIKMNLPVHRMLSADGYGRYVKQMLHALLLSGDFDVKPFLAEQFEWEGWVQQAAGIDHSRLTLNVAPAMYLRSIPARQWILTMYESTAIPDGWANLINAHTERMIAPCQWVADVFADNGVTVPIHVVPGGVDVNECALLPPVRAGTRPYTFLALADRGNRKGWDTVFSAFCETFRAEDDVALIIKARSPDILNQFPPQGIRDAVTRKIRFWVGDIGNVRDIFAQADCCVYPATADGWGMFPREAAACGLPAIVTNYSGTAVGCDQWAIPLNDYHMVDSADLPTAQHPGMWAEPNGEEVGHWMRWCFDHPDEAHQRGHEAAAWLRANQTWAHSAQALKTLIDDLDIRRLQAWELETAQFEDAVQQSQVRLGELLREHSNGSRGI